MSTPTPLMAAITAVISEIVAVVVGFGILDNSKAGLVIGLGNAVVVLGALIYAAAHKTSVATVTAAQVRVGAVPVIPAPAGLPTNAAELADQPPADAGFAPVSAGAPDPSVPA